VGQALTGVRLILLSLREGLQDDVTATRLHACVEAIDQALDVVRTFATDLRPEVLDSLGLESAIKWHLHQTNRDAGLRVSFEADASLPLLGRETELACFRVFQEAAMNVIRHAGAGTLTVRLLHRDGHLILAVVDDGVGFDVGEVLGRSQLGGRLGLDGMAERARLLGGSVDFASTPGHGTAVTARFPTAALGEHEAPSS
jgi:signal transduction histidine kinase